MQAEIIAHIGSVVVNKVLTNQPFMQQFSSDSSSIMPQIIQCVMPELIKYVAKRSNLPILTTIATIMRGGGNPSLHETFSKHTQVITEAAKSLLQVNLLDTITKLKEILNLLNDQFLTINTGLFAIKLRIAWNILDSVKEDKKNEIAFYIFMILFADLFKPAVSNFIKGIKKLIPNNTSTGDESTSSDQQLDVMRLINKMEDKERAVQQNLDAQSTASDEQERHAFESETQPRGLVGGERKKSFKKYRKKRKRFSKRQR